jgi:DNA-binding IscR family transcriptional regulator
MLEQIYRAITDTALIALPNKGPNKSCAISCRMSDVLVKLSREIEEVTLRQLAKRNLGEILAQLKIS